MDDLIPEPEEWDDEEREYKPAAERSPGDITAAEKYEFLTHIRNGLNRQEAAGMLGYRGRHFRSLCSPTSSFYDESFASLYGEATRSLEHAEGRLERLQAEAQRRALNGSDRLMEKLLMVYWPEYREAHTSREVNVNVRQLIQTQFRSLPTDKLDQLIAWLDEHEEIEEAEFKELTAGAS